MQDALLGRLAGWYVQYQLHVRLVEKADAERNWWRDETAASLRPVR